MNILLVFYWMNLFDTNWISQIDFHFINDVFLSTKKNLINKWSLKFYLYYLNTKKNVCLFCKIIMIY